MCGRFVFVDLVSFLELLEQYELPFEAAEGFRFNASYNIAPESEIVILKGDHGRYRLDVAHWGLVPHWAKEMPKVRPINARAESLGQKPYFRHMVNRSHCLIPASGFYEWSIGGGGAKQPYYIRRKDERPMAFAGLWDRWVPQEQGAPAVQSCTIVTTDANSEMQAVHDRMPVILEPEEWGAWLQAGRQGSMELLRPAGDESLELYPVSKRVSNPRHGGHECIERVE